MAAKNCAVLKKKETKGYMVSSTKAEYIKFIYTLINPNTLHMPYTDRLWERHYQHLVNHLTCKHLTSHPYWYCCH